MALTKQELIKLWQRPPEKQIAVMQAKILEAISITNGKIAVCFSGGKDSAYLLYKTAEIWESLYKNVPLVCCFADTTNEHYLTKKYIKEFIPFVESKFGIKIDFHITKPFLHNKKAKKKTPISFVTVSKTEGLPLISKTVSMEIRKLRIALKAAKLKFEDVRTYTKQTLENVKTLEKMGLSKTGILTITGYSYKRKGFGQSFRLAKRWYPIIDSDIILSEKCCFYLKKEPMRLMLKSLGNYQPVIGEMAQDSKQRSDAYLSTGCNHFVNGKGKSKPMGSMTEQGVLYGISVDNVPISDYYGVLECHECKYKFSKENRGGCALCGFGIDFEPDRFIKLQEYEPAKVKWAFTPKEKGGGGYLEACTFLNKYCKCKIQIPRIKQGQPFEPEIAEMSEGVEVER